MSSKSKNPRDNTENPEVRPEVTKKTPVHIQSKRRGTERCRSRSKSSVSLGVSQVSRSRSKSRDKYCSSEWDQEAGSLHDEDDDNNEKKEEAVEGKEFGIF